jgi:hypothetical protein
LQGIPRRSGAFAGPGPRLDHSSPSSAQDRSTPPERGTHHRATIARRRMTPAWNRLGLSVGRRNPHARSRSGHTDPLQGLVRVLRAAGHDIGGKRPPRQLPRPRRPRTRDRARLAALADVSLTRRRLTYDLP